MRYFVLISNVGTVHVGTDRAEALREYNDAIERSTDKDVALFCDGGVMAEHHAQ